MIANDGLLDVNESLATVLKVFLDASPGWEHPSFESLVGSLTLEQVLWRPNGKRHCVWDIVRHMVHWRAVVRARICGTTEPAKDDWPGLPATVSREESERAWRSDLERFRKESEALIEGVGTLDPQRRNRNEGSSHLPLWLSAVTIQIHDSYHLGQIAQLRGLQGLPHAE